MSTRTESSPGSKWTDGVDLSSEHAADIPCLTAGTTFPALLPNAKLHGPQWELVLRIASSRRFERSTLLKNFLLFACHRALTGEAATINEQLIGVHVFGRTAQFNRSDDNIVRNYARMLRKRIDEYFECEGVDEPILLHVPRGGYVPVFMARTSDPIEASFIEPPDSQPQLTAGNSANLYDGPPKSDTAPLRPSHSRWSIAAIILLSALSGFAGAKLAPQWFHRDGSASRSSHIFWKTMFSTDRDTFIVPSDGGLVILHRFLERPTNLTEYISGAYRRPEIIAQGLRDLTKTGVGSELSILSQRVASLGDRRYTSVVDLDLSARIPRQREVFPERLFIRYARELSMDDLKSSNAILIGSVDSNPWVELFQTALNFQFADGGPFGGSATIINRHPLPGEKTTYASITGDPAQNTYGVIAYLPNLSGTGHVLIVEGINMAGTQAAGEFLLNPDAMQPVLQHAAGARGELRSFEVLLETNNIAANSSQSRVLSERVTGL